jgi:hypothetical protein
LIARYVPKPKPEPEPASSEPLPSPSPEPRPEQVAPPKAVLDIGAALTDERLFGRWFGAKSWSGWRTVVRAANGEPLSRSERAFFATVAGDRAPPSKPVKELWCLCGRRSGKDSMASVIAAYMAASFKGAGVLRPGERATLACLAVDRSQASIVHDYTKAYFEAVPALSAMVRRETVDGLELTNGVDIQITTSDFRAARGRSYLGIVMDEVAYWRDEDSSVNPDREIYRGLRPGMATIPGSMLIGITSVYKRSGLAYDRWAKHFRKDNDRILVVHAPSIALNPTLDQAEIDAALAEDAVAASADYLSQWRDDLNSYVPRDLIEGAIDRGVTERPYQPGTRYVAFDDAAEGVSATGDSYTAAVAHRDGDMVILDWAIEFRGKFNTASVTKQIADALHRYHIREIVGDCHARGFSTNEYARHSIRKQDCDLDRSELYLEILPRFGAGRVRLLDNPRLINQFCALERRAMSGGGDKVNHPRGQNDDLANAVAGALWCAASKRPAMNITPDVIARAGLPAGRSMDRYNQVGPAGSSMYGLVKSGMI